MEKVEIGPHVLYHGDSRELLPQIALPEDTAIVTDPPYGIFACGGKWGRKADLQWDKEPASIEFFLEKSKQIVIWGGNYFPLPPSRGWLVWYKRDSVPSAADVELAWTSFDMNARLVDQTIAATNAERCGHPTQKPLKVMLWTLGFVSSETVFDPFMGSGSTGEACVATGIGFVGIETERKWFDYSCQRIEKAVEEQKGKFKLPEVKKPEVLKASFFK